MNQKQNKFGALQGRRGHIQSLISIIGCVSIYGITISLFTPLLSLILEAQAVSSTLIGGLAIMTPFGVILGSFFVPRCLQIFSGRRLLLTAIGFEILLIVFLITSQSLSFPLVFTGKIRGSQGKSDKFLLLCSGYPKGYRRKQLLGWFR